MNRLIGGIALLFVLTGLQAQDLASLSFAEMDSLLLLYEGQPARYAEKGVQLSLHGSQRAQDDVGLAGEYWEWAAYFYENRGDDNEAIEAYRNALERFEQAYGVRSPRYATTLSFLGDFYVGKGEYDQALAVYLQSKDIREAVLGVQHPDFASSINDLAILHQTMGNYQKALPLYLQSKDIKEAIFGNQHSQYATSLINLASLHRKMGKYEEALAFFNQAIEIEQHTVNDPLSRFSTLLNSLALLHKDLGNYDKALACFQQTLDLQRKTLGPLHPRFAISLNNLAGLYAEMEDYDKALTLYKQVLSIHQTVLGDHHPNAALVQHNMAVLNQRIGNYPVAWANVGQALETATGQAMSVAVDSLWADALLQTNFASNQHLNITIKVLGTIYTLLKEDASIPQAAQRQRLVTDLATTLLAQLRNNLSSDRDKIRLLAKSHQWLQRSLDDLYGLQAASKAFALVDQNKSVLLLQASKSEQAYRLGNLPDSLVQRDKELRQQRSQLNAQLLEERTADEKNRLRDAFNRTQQALDDLVQHIQTHYPKYHQLRYQQPTAHVGDVQHLLDDQTALLEYAISDSAVHIFYIDQQTVVWKKVAVLRRQLTDRIQRLRRALTSTQLLGSDPNLSYQLYTEQAHWFYQHLIAPVLTGQDHIRHLVVVPDGELGHLPFESFLTERAPQAAVSYHQLAYLLNDYAISYNYSAALWKENRTAPTPQNNGQLFGVAANYALALDSVQLVARLPTDRSARATLTPLPGARQEVELLQRHYRGFFAFDSLASEKVVKERAEDFAILHFATHGLLDAQRPILSALALSEDNDPTESNFWQAYEISKMQLHAELVVLSACETGYGAFEQGNGVASLARAFMYAGAPSLVVSLWQVNDYATSQIMERFYHHLAEGLPVDQALRQAKLDYLQTATGTAAHPLFWSPFVHLGKTQPVALQSKRSGWFGWGLLGLSGVLLVFGAWAVRRKV